MDDVAADLSADFFSSCDLLHAPRTARLRPQPRGSRIRSAGRARKLVASKSFQSSAVSARSANPSDYCHFPQLCRIVYRKSPSVTDDTERPSGNSGLSTPLRKTPKGPTRGERRRLCDSLSREEMRQLSEHDVSDLWRHPLVAGSGRVIGTAKDADSGSMSARPEYASSCHPRYAAVAAEQTPVGRLSTTTIATLLTSARKSADKVLSASPSLLRKDRRDPVPNANPFA